MAFLNQWYRQLQWAAFIVMWCYPVADAETIWSPADTPPIVESERPIDAETNRLLRALMDDSVFRRSDLDSTQLALLLMERLEAPVRGKPFPASENRWVPYERALEILARLKDRHDAALDWLDTTASKRPTPGAIMTTMRACLIRAYWHIDQNRPSAAYKNIEMLISFGRLIESARGGLINAMMGIALSKDVLRHTAHILPHLQTDDLRRLAERLAKHSIAPSQVVRSLPFEARNFEQHLVSVGQMNSAELFENVITPSGIDGATVKSALEGYDTASAQEMIRFLYDPSKTIAYSRRYWARVIAEAAKPPLARKLPGPIELHQAPNAMIDNPVGRILLSVATPSFEQFLEREDRIRNYRRMLLVRTAIELFLREEERSPRNLDELVPKYLQDLPRDLFTQSSLSDTSQKPFNYSESPCRIWSAAPPSPLRAPHEILCDLPKAPLKESNIP